MKNKSEANKRKINKSEIHIKKSEIGKENVEREEIRKSKVELLAPAGSYESLVAAIKAGADAVYIGGQRFGARAYADNLDTQRMIEAIDYVHLHGKKIYMTVNTLLKPGEMGQLYDYLLPYYEAGLDAVIVQDMGVLAFVRKHFPDLDIHASTQMNVVGVAAAKFLKNLGIKRVVTARELSLAEIQEIYDETGLEIESFVHGALCYCYSGQCLMSSILGGRSGNRGRCAQPCRLPYELRGKQAYYLSPKDMAAVSILPKLIESGIYSFKIEGRMKRAEYVALVTSIYRKYIDLYEAGKPCALSREDEQLLMEIYNRGGFHAGYYEQKNGRNMMSIERPNHIGVFVGRIEQIKQNQIQFRTALPLQKQDVLEIHTKQGGVELTCPVFAKQGEKVTLNAQKIKLLKKGQDIYRVKSLHLLEQIQTTIIQKDNRIPIRGHVSAKVGQKLCIELFCGDSYLKVEGDVVEQANKNPVTKEQMLAKIDQLKETPFYFEQLDGTVCGDCFLPVSLLKKMRREAIKQLEQTILCRFRRTKCNMQNEIQEENVQKREYFMQNETQEEERFSHENKKEDALSCHIKRRESLLYDIKIEKDGTVKDEIAQWTKKEKKKTQLVVSITNTSYLPIVLKKEEVAAVYVELSHISFEEMEDITRRCKKAGKKIYYMMPYVFRSKAQKEYELHKEQLFFGEHDGFLVRNIDSFAFLENSEQYEKEIKLDYCLYCYNEAAIAFFAQSNKKISFTMPLELHEKELKELVFPIADMICYSRFPLMISAQCVKKTTNCCDKKESYLTLKDRYDKQFLVKTECKYCYNLIYNGLPLSLLDCQKEIKEMNPEQIRLHFVNESVNEAEQIINDFIRGKKKTQQNFTRGHFKRGIE